MELTMCLITIRASSLPELFDCAARWETKHINKRRMPSSGNAVLGRAVHAGTALFDGSALLGEPVSIDDAIGTVVDAIYRPDEDVKWYEGSPKKAEPIAIALHKLYCKTIAPTQDYIAVEARCKRLEINELGIALEGTLDRLHRLKDEIGVTDIKSGIQSVDARGKVKTQGHEAQIAVYELLAEQELQVPVRAPAQIIGLQVAETAKGRRAGIGTITDGRKLLLGDDENMGVLQYASKIIHSGLFVGNPKSMMCHEKYCPIYKQCRFRR